jgi:diguanylate cyclase (GGDEF)-like protein/PAS domain S-box-containing protein
MNSKFFPIANFTDLLLDAVCMVDATGRFVFVSAACERIFGYTQGEMTGMAMIDLVAPADRERTLMAAHDIMNGQPRTGFENRYVRKDGSIVHIMWSACWSEADQLRVAVARDITAKKRAEAMQTALYAISEAAHATEDLPALFHSIHQIITELMPAPGFAIALRIEHDHQLRFVYHADDRGPMPHPPVPNSSVEEILQRSQPQLLGEQWLAVPLSTAQDQIGVLMLNCARQSAGGDSQDQDLLTFVSTQVATAIQRKQLHTRLRFMAQHDELTRLPNRRLFHDRLDTALVRSKRQQSQLSLLFIDLNKFKQVNDQYGHAVGDLVLREIAQRIKASVREADTVARIGGDEFVVLLEHVARPEHTALVRDKILLALAAPVKLDGGGTLHIAASIGMAHYPEHGADVQELLRHADQTMYAFKQFAASAAA